MAQPFRADQPPHMASTSLAWPCITQGLNRCQCSYVSDWSIFLLSGRVMGISRKYLRPRRIEFPGVSFFLRGSTDVAEERRCAGLLRRAGSKQALVSPDGLQQQKQVCTTRPKPYPREIQPDCCRRLCCRVPWLNCWIAAAKATTVLWDGSCNGHHDSVPRHEGVCGKSGCPH